MSLDVSLYEPFPVPRAACFWCAIDDDEHVHRGTCLFEQNITHNLNEMADVAGIYKVLWRPDELFDEPRARDIVDALQQGYDTLKADPERFIPFEPENKWGTYWGFLPWLERYITACRTWPDAVVLASR
jgi:hypothetical protein